MSRILLLEDDPVLSNEISTFLKSKGFACDCVFDGDVFFRQLNAGPYDVYLLDINVPRQNAVWKYAGRFASPTKVPPS